MKLDTGIGHLPYELGRGQHSLKVEIKPLEATLSSFNSLIPIYMEKNDCKKEKTYEDWVEERLELQAEINRGK